MESVVFVLISIHSITFYKVNTIERKIYHKISLWLRFSTISRLDKALGRDEIGGKSRMIFQMNFLKHFYFFHSFKPTVMTPFWTNSPWAMAWHERDDWPLSKQMLVQFAEANMYYQASVGRDITQGLISHSAEKCFNNQWLQNHFTFHFVIRAATDGRSIVRF